MHPVAKVKILQNLKALHFDAARPPGACDVGEVWAVQVCLLYHHANFIIIINVALYIEIEELQTNWRPDRWSDY